MHFAIKSILISAFFALLFIILREYDIATEKDSLISYAGAVLYLLSIGLTLLYDLKSERI